MVLLRLLLLIQFMNENQKCNSALKSLACNYTYAHMLFFGCFKHSFSASKIAFAAANCLHELMCAWAYVVLTSQVGVKFAKSKSSGQYDRATQNRIDWRGHRTFDVLFYKFCDPSCHWPAQSMCFCDSTNHRVDIYFEQYFANVHLVHLPIVVGLYIHQLWPVYRWTCIEPMRLKQVYPMGMPWFLACVTLSWTQHQVSCTHAIFRLAAHANKL